MYQISTLWFFVFLIQIDALSSDMIDETCKKCGDESVSFSYNVCSTSLQSIPISHVTNLKGLAIISMGLALSNATNTVSTIKNMMISTDEETRYGRPNIACLEDCLELYSDAVLTILDANQAFLYGHYGDVNAKLSAVMTSTTTCNDGFSDLQEISPLAQENYSLFQLCDIPLCITNLLSHSANS